jgi:hypothetical protein
VKRYLLENNMARTVKANATRPAAQSTAAVGRVFTISLQGIPRVTPQSRARLEAAARSATNTRRDYPLLNTD